VDADTLMDEADVVATVVAAADVVVTTDSDAFTGADDAIVAITLYLGISVFLALDVHVFCLNATGSVA